MFRKSILSTIAIFSASTACADVLEIATTYLERELGHLNVVYSCIKADQVPSNYADQGYSVSGAAMPAAVSGSFLAQTGDVTILLVDTSCMDEVVRGFTSVGLPESALVITPTQNLSM